MALFSKISSWIIGPIFFAVFFGKWIAEKYEAGPWIFLVILGIASGVSFFGIIKETTQEMKKNNKDIKNKL